MKNSLNKFLHRKKIRIIGITSLTALSLFGVIKEKSYIKNNSNNKIQVYDSIAFGERGIDLTYTSDNKGTKENVQTDTIYITIDDGPRPNSVKIAKALSQTGHQATFFFVGEQIELYFDEAVEVAKLGHIIGNHSYAHNSYKDMPVEQAKKDVTKTNTLIRKVLNKAQSNQKNIPFRYPYGASMNNKKNESQKHTNSELFRLFMEKNHHNIYFWSNRDIKDRDKNTQADSVTSFIIGSQNHEIILLHDLRATTLEGISNFTKKNNRTDKNNSPKKKISIGLN